MATLSNFQQIILNKNLALLPGLFVQTMLESDQLSLNFKLLSAKRKVSEYYIKVQLKVPKKYVVFQMLYFVT